MSTVKILATQPDDVEPFEFTHFDQWGPGVTDTDVAAAWSQTLGIEFDQETREDIYAAADVVAADPRYAIYPGEGFIEIYRVADLPADVEYEEG